jgi:hypothetical protein
VYPNSWQMSNFGGIAKLAILAKAKAVVDKASFL